MVNIVPSNVEGWTEGHLPLRGDFIVTTDDMNAAEQLLTLLENEKPSVFHIDNYYYGKQRMPYMPTSASDEYKELARRSITNMIPLIIGNLSQLLVVEGYLPSYTTPDDEGENAKPWEAWEANRMNKKQSMLFKAMLKYGVAYTVQLPGGPKDLPEIRVVSPSRIVAGYEDPVNDEWPLYALEERGIQNEYMYYYLYTDTQVVPLVRSTVARTDSKPQPLELDMNNEAFLHGSSHVPVTQYTYDMDDSGRYTGEVRNIETLQDRLNQTNMDRLLIQTFQSWTIRTISGMERPATQAEADKEKIQMQIDRILVSDSPDTKFGTLAGTPLDGILQAGNVDQETIAALESVPPHYLTGSLNNLGAEAIAEARASMVARAAEIRRAVGEGIRQTMRSCAEIMGLTKDAEDFRAQVLWHDSQNWSLSQVADALGKLATMLNVPVTELWGKIPGVTQSDVRRWKSVYEQEQFDTQMSEADQDAQEAVANGDESDTPNDGAEQQGSSQSTERS